jgi:hypothetical protein
MYDLLINDRIIKSVNNLKYPFALILHYLQFTIITMINILGINMFLDRLLRLLRGTIKAHISFCKLPKSLCLSLNLKI